MSQSASTSRPYGWSETEFYDRMDSGEDDSDDENAEHGPHHREYGGTSRAEWIAHGILRETARLLCARTALEEPWAGGDLAEAVALVLDDDSGHDGRASETHTENREVELSDPTMVLGRSAGAGWGIREYGQYRRRRRINPETGYISGGESTGVLIADRPLPAFMAVVNLVLMSNVTGPDEATEIRAWARAEKQAGQQRDVDILSGVLAMLGAEAE
jgi:hypothetical protein